jgi:hypothetical protein
VAGGRWKTYAFYAVTADCVVLSAWMICRAATPVAIGCDDERRDFTLDIDATQIVAEKREARYSYKGEGLRAFSTDSVA